MKQNRISNSTVPGVPALAVATGTDENPYRSVKFPVFPVSPANSNGEIVRSSEGILGSKSPDSHE